ncbi:MAG: sodium:alanine symporter family protein [Oscillospiraceae bacterium]|nr:sodium:alanine symporter family protein [Oscillospiraceae bacterium]
MMLLFLGVGLLFTVRLRGVQFRCLGRALRLVRPRQGKDGVSPYAALCTALAATVGTGNIVGVATALGTGGPGALLWMLVAAVFGMATQYAEGYLAVKYRRKDGNGFFGGPFCYIEQGLGKRFRWLAVTFAATGAAVGILGIGTTAQVNSITGAADAFFSSGTAFVFAGHAYSRTVVVSGALTALAAALVLFGGVRRITRVCEALVPVMTTLYLLFSAVLLICCADRIPSAAALIVKSAFCPRAVLGAGTGVSLKLALRMGIGRGVFTNEAGLGSSPIAAAVSDETDPVKQGLISMTGTFIDTIVICTMTGLCLTVTGAWKTPLQGVEITDAAWRAGLPWAERVSSFVLVICLIFFAFATIIGWNFYAERCVQYLVGEKPLLQKLYRVFYLFAVAVGPYFSVSAAWELADILNAAMALPNLTALLLLQNRVVYGTLRTKPKK